MWPLLAGAAFGLVKGFTSKRALPFNAQHDLWGPAREEVVYRAAPLWLFPNLPFGSTAVTFAADHVLSDSRHSTGMGATELLARFGDVLLGGAIYESAFRRFGLLGAIAAHAAHNVGVGLGSRARNKA